MCQLLGVSTLAPIRMSFSWKRFAMRGSETVGNPDGWGVAHAESTDVRILREPSPAEDSELVAFLSQHGPTSTTVISHVRRATVGDRSLANTHPFVRILGGRTHIFAHNGHVSSLEAPKSPWLQPVGTTDSELMFCILLSRLEELWRDSNAPPLDRRTEVISAFAQEMRALGAANFLYFDGITLFAHAHRRTLPGAVVSKEPGLYSLLHDREIGADDLGPCLGLSSVGKCTPQVLVATLPLDDEGWTPLAAGELLRVEHGALV